MITTNCQWCGKEVTRNGSKPARFCSMACKSEWQRTQKPVDRDWLVQKYINEGLGTYQIAKLVKRNPKQVYTWLVGYGIEIRGRAWSTEAGGQPFHDRDWLIEEYVNKQRSTGEIAAQFGVTDATISFWLDKHGIAARTIVEARKVKHWSLRGKVNGMYGRRSPNWKGGCTPERQAFYSSIAWSEAVRIVWRRDKGICQRCGAKRNHAGTQFHIHHIVSFRVAALRAEPTNLVLLCVECHHFVHGRNNINGEFIKHHEE